jgi:DnaJ-class molecular chaperone
MHFLQKLPEQVKRLSLVFVVMIAGTAIIYYTLPRPLRDRDMQKKATIERIKAIEIKYAGSAVCADCHEEKYRLKETGYHKNLSCETCHGPTNEHANDPGEAIPFVISEREHCAHCHEYNASRPKGFPQINPVAHNPMEPCMNCHNPHDPKPLETPHECKACHANIARTKAVSPHVLISCTTCHEAPEQHKITPRMIRPTIPNKREFCGQCHSKTSTEKGTPKIDILTHGEKYLCWQCHYPHMPEAGR